MTKSETHPLHGTNDDINEEEDMVIKRFKKEFFISPVTENIQYIDIG